MAAAPKTWLLLYRLDDPDIWVRQSPYWTQAPDHITRLYVPVAAASSWLTEFGGETRFVVAPPSGDSRGPWSVVYTPPFDIADFIHQVDTSGEEMP